jgi:hypothetical protein
LFVDLSDLDNDDDEGSIATFANKESFVVVVVDRVGSQSLLLGGKVRCTTSGVSSFDEKDDDCAIAIPLPSAPAARRMFDGGVRKGGGG